MKQMCVDEEFEDIRGEMMADLEKRRGDSIAPPDYHGYLGIPAEVPVEEYSQHLDGGRRGDSRAGNIDTETSCTFKGSMCADDSKVRLVRAHF